MKKIFALLTLGIFLLGIVSANQFMGESQLSYKVQTKYMNQLNCSEYCSMFEDGNKLGFEVKETRKFLGLRLEQKTQYFLDNNGEITKVKRNFWSRFLGQKVIEE